MYIQALLGIIVVFQSILIFDMYFDNKNGSSQDDGICFGIENVRVGQKADSSNLSNTNNLEIKPVPNKEAGISAQNENSNNEEEINTAEKPQQEEPAWQELEFDQLLESKHRGVEIKDRNPASNSKEPLEVFYHTLANDNPVTISYNIFGHYRNWKKIIAANPTVNFSKLQPNIAIKVPMGEANQEVRDKRPL